MTDTLDTLVDDIYMLMQNKNSAKGVDVEGEIEKFGENMKQLMRKEFLPGIGNFAGRGGLRLSSIGKPELQQWYSVNKFSGEKIKPATLIKFMYGHLIEEMLLLFVALSGHEVTDQQKKCNVGGISGHMDCKIDGVVVDVKSTTNYGIKKFQDGTLAADDNFGYIDQIKAYAHSEGERKWAWLAMDKQNGTLAVLKYDLDDTSHPMYNNYSGDIEERVAHVKKSVGGEVKPERCEGSSPVPDGKSGNLKLPTICSYCQYKEHCHPDLRTFIYSTGPRFLTKVVKKPDVPEVDKNF